MDASMTSDMGSMPTDMSSVDAAALHAQVVATLPTLPIASVSVGGGGTALPDYSCRGTWDQSTADGVEVTGNFNFDYGGPLGTTVDVKIFPSNDIPVSTVCTGSCFTRLTDASGSTAAFTLTTGRFTAWATPAWTPIWGDHITAASGYFYMSDAFVSSGVRETTPSDAELETAYSRGSVTYTAGTSATLFGIVRDCLGRSVQGAAIRVFGETGLRQDLEPPVVRYENVALAATGNPQWTSNRGEFLGLDMRPADTDGTLMRIEAWANLGASTPELVACEKIRIFGGNYATLRFIPRRSTSPSDCTP